MCKGVVLEAEVGYHLTNQGHLLYVRENHGLANVRLPWYNGLSFRTREQSPAVLMTIELGGTAMNDHPSHIVIRVCFVVFGVQFLNYGVFNVLRLQIIVWQCRRHDLLL